MNVAEIIEQLPGLSSPELAQVQAKLSELVMPTRPSTQIDAVVAHPTAHIWPMRNNQKIS